MRCYCHLVGYHNAILDEAGVEVTDLEAVDDAKSAPLSFRSFLNHFCRFHKV